VRRKSGVGVVVGWGEEEEWGGVGGRRRSGVGEL
jgi:hypothetical protein